VEEGERKGFFSKAERGGSNAGRLEGEGGKKKRTPRSGLVFLTDARGKGKKKLSYLVKRPPFRRYELIRGGEGGRGSPRTSPNFAPRKEKKKRKKMIIPSQKKEGGGRGPYWRRARMGRRGGGGKEKKRTKGGKKGEGEKEKRKVLPLLLLQGGENEEGKKKEILLFFN